MYCSIQCHPHQLPSISDSPNKQNRNNIPRTAKMEYVKYVPNTTKTKRIKKKI